MNKLPFVCINGRFLLLSRTASISSKLFDGTLAAGNSFFLIGTGGGGVFGWASGNFGDPFATIGFGIERTTAITNFKSAISVNVSWNRNAALTF